MTQKGQFTQHEASTTQPVKVVVYCILWLEKRLFSLYLGLKKTNLLTARVTVGAFT